MQVTWINTGRRIDGAMKCRAWIAWTQGPPDHISARAIFKGVITVEIESRATHPDRRIAIQGARSNAFYNASQRLHPDAPSKIRRLRHF